MKEVSGKLITSAHFLSTPHASPLVPRLNGFLTLVNIGKLSKSSDA